MPYEFLEHPSDIIVLGRNTTFEKAFEDVANGMFVQMGAEDAQEKESFELEYSAPNQEQLVVQTLTEIIAECETRPLTPKRMEVVSCRFPVSGFQLPVSGLESRVSGSGHATLDTGHSTLDTEHSIPDTVPGDRLPVSGSPFWVLVRVHGERKVPENIIKAVTYNSLRIEKKGENWEIEVLFDI